MEAVELIKSGKDQKNTKFNKILKFLASIFLADITILYSIYLYFKKLNSKGILDLDLNFTGTELIWGNTIWLNIIHIFILGICGGIFGLIFGYLSRQLSKTEKRIYTIVYVFNKILLIAIFSLLIELSKTNNIETINNIGNVLLNYYTNSIFNIVFITLNYITVFLSVYYFINIGLDIRNDPNNKLDKESKYTFLDIKWYHYIWLGWPIGFYLHYILDLILKIVLAIIQLSKKLNFEDLISPISSTVDKIDIAQHNLFVILSKGMIASGILVYQRKILTREIKYHWSIKLLLSLCISFLLPYILIYYNRYC